MARLSSVLLLSAAALAENCGPTRQEVGQAVVIAWPAVLALTLLVQLGLLAIWRRKWPAVRTPWVSPLLLFAVAVSMSLGMVVHLDKPWQWSGMALWLFGCSYAAVVLLVTRIWLLGDVRFPLVGPHFVAGVLFLGPAVIIAGIPGPSHTDLEALYIFPGMGGWVPAGLFLLTYGEALIRTRRRT